MMDDATRDRLRREFPDVPVFTKHTTAESRADATIEYLEAVIVGLYARLDMLGAGPHDRPDCPCGHPVGEQGRCAMCNCADDPP